MSKSSDNKGLSGKLSKFTIKRVFLVMALPICALLALVMFVGAIIAIGTTASDSEKSMLELETGMRKQAEKIVGSQCLAQMKDIAREQANVINLELSQLGELTDEEEAAEIQTLVTAFNENKARGFTLVLKLNERGKFESFAALSEKSKNYEASDNGASFVNFYDRYKKERPSVAQIFEPFSNSATKSKDYLCPDYSLVNEKYLVVAAITQDEALTLTSEFNAGLNAEVVKANKYVNDMKTQAYIIFFIAGGLITAGGIFILIAGLHKFVSRPLHDLVFDIKKKLDDLEGLDLTLRKDTRNEIDITRDAFFKVVEDLKEHMDDVLKLSGLTEKFENSANFDMLTGIYNRRRFLELVSKHAVLAAKKNEPTFVIMLDLDKFKNVNDTYGHAAGDAVLKTISTRVKETVRPYDLFGRYGGEEFVMFISVADSSNAVGFADRIRGIIEAAPVTFEDLVIPVTASMGVAQSAPDVSFEDAQKHADEALYKAKANGRNRVELYISGEESVLEQKQKELAEHPEKALEDEH